MFHPIWSCLDGSEGGIFWPPRRQGAISKRSVAEIGVLDALPLFQACKSGGITSCLDCEVASGLSALSTFGWVDATYKRNDTRPS